MVKPLTRSDSPASMAPLHYRSYADDNVRAHTAASRANENILRLLGGARDSNGLSNRQSIATSPKLTRKVLEEGMEDGEVTSADGGGGPLTLLSSALEAFRPDLVIISAGLDSRKGHPCRRGELVAEDFEWLTRQVCLAAVTGVFLSFGVHDYI